jgi:hypothetical protein
MAKLIKYRQKATANFGIRCHMFFSGQRLAFGGTTTAAPIRFRRSDLSRKNTTILTFKQAA